MSSVGEQSPWEQIGPVMFDARRFAEAPTEVELVLALLEVDPPAAILDLGCGPGRHLLELARRGYRVTGVDATASFLETAWRSARSEGLSVELVHEDMRRFVRAESFDAVISMATSFGYFDDPEDDRGVLVNVSRSLRREGVVLMELMGKEVVARTLKSRDWSQEQSAFLLTEQRVRDDWSWVDNRLIFLADGVQHEFVLSHRLYSASELASVLSAAGFSSVQAYGDLTGSPYDDAEIGRASCRERVCLVV